MLAEFDKLLTDQAELQGMSRMLDDGMGRMHSAPLSHFPHRLWDVNIILKGGMNLHNHQDPAFSKGLDEFVKTIWFEPGQSLIIFWCENGNILCRNSQNPENRQTALLAISHPSMTTDPHIFTNWALSPDELVDR
ncbi:hypothetical protein TSTA_015550 [Talaromyces stipitatus ATCC 10500]|uniref:Uncharacterized protein n=1 Tax=Talaromyces stipitatus (strain ATCC 10500 / CBS 375.48 / QM 6759 / NRRL 1006) TaxID=441959 RepID=B8MHY8_TALSN|nr:uncharacterized protein TSTA_015550 [Talaromyces stipitatus ATCC 10500]EED16468.1 hypothetical protein TSTA_015550 [Talaromyces stipitatus ATCC 10500]